MLKRIEKWGVENGYFIYDSLKEVSDKTCLCKDLKLIDFDKTTQKVIEEANQNTRTSCDGLNLSKSIDFIEFKSFEDVKRKFYDDENIERKERRFLNTTKTSLPDKIASSIWIFQYILGHKNFLATKQEKEQYRNTIKNYFLVVDIDLKQNSKESLIAKLNGLALPSSLYDTLIIQVSSILNDIDGDIKINQAKLIDCKQLKEFLSK